MIGNDMITFREIRLFFKNIKSRNIHNIVYYKSTINSQFKIDVQSSTTCSIKKINSGRIAVAV